MIGAIRRLIHEAADNLKRSEAFQWFIIVINILLVLGIVYYSNDQKERIIYWKSEALKYRAIVDSSSDKKLLFDLKTSIDSIKESTKDIYKVWSIGRKIDTLIKKNKKDDF